MASNQNFIEKRPPLFFKKKMGVVFLQFFDLMASLAFFCQFLYFVNRSIGILRQWAPSNQNFAERRPSLFLKNNGGHFSSKFCFFGVLIPFWSIFYQSIRWHLEAMDDLKFLKMSHWRRRVAKNQNFVERRPLLFSKNNGGRFSTKFWFEAIHCL